MRSEWNYLLSSWTGSNLVLLEQIYLLNDISNLANGASVTYTVTIDIPNTLESLVSEASATSDISDLFPVSQLYRYKYYCET
jgi:hypothetical protein